MASCAGVSGGGCAKKSFGIARFNGAGAGAEAAAPGARPASGSGAATGVALS